MSIEINDAKFQQILEMAVGQQRIKPKEIRAIVQLMQLAAWIDLEDDPSERALVQALTYRLCAWGDLASISIPPLSPVPIDAEERAARVAMLAHQLDTSAARDLAYVLTYLVVVVDLELAPVESDLLEQVQHALAIPATRGGALIDAIAWVVTPEELPAPEPGAADRRAPGPPSSP